MSAMGDHPLRLRTAGPAAAGLAFATLMTVALTLVAFGSGALVPGGLLAGGSGGDASPSLFEAMDHFDDLEVLSAPFVPELGPGVWISLPRAVSLSSRACRPPVRPPSP